MPKVINPDQLNEFWKLWGGGWTAKEAAAKAGFSERTANRLVRERKEAERDAGPTTGRQAGHFTPGAERFEPRQQRAVDVPIRPLLKSELSEVALDCLADFGRFRARYFGRHSSPWQEHAANVCVEKLSTMEREFGVINVAPGGGKSTLFTHDIPAWITARNRSIRGFIGSSTETIAKSYTGRLRNTFERTIPEEADEEALRLNLASDAKATLAQDYGRFRPVHDPDQANPPWSMSQFTVMQHGETAVGDKETTWSAWGWNSGFIGWRVNFIIWDDLVTDENAFTSEEQRNKMRQRWTNTAERRLEPGGLLILQGQRISSEDLYRYCIDRMVPDFHEDMFERMDLGTEELPMVRKYFHIVYPAHNTETCRAVEDPRMHSMRAPAFDPANPDTSGCLLDPVRVPWREQLSVMTDSMKTYVTVFQQEDSDPDSVLIPEIWINGGEDDNGEYPGCWDDDRDIGVLPRVPKGSRTFSYINVDPSPTKLWAIEWWYYVEAPSDKPMMGRRYLIDLINKRMPVDSFLDFNVRDNRYRGVLTEWVDRARRLGAPIGYLIFEQNAAQRFVLQYSWFKLYLQQNNIQIMAHTTSSNKTDPEYGVETLRPHYRFGRKRLPGTPAARKVVARLVFELTHYPDAVTNDTVMADWFGEFNLPRFRKRESGMPNVWKNVMPGFLKGA